MASPDEIKALYRQHFPAFLRFAFRELHPGQKLIDTPHIDVPADHLARVARGDITRLIINMPPRSLKSFSASVALPAWLLGRDPTRQIISVAGTKELVWRRALIDLLVPHRSFQLRRAERHTSTHYR